MTPSRATAGAGAAARLLRIVREMMLVSVIGGVIALAANYVSPRGLTITRDYFPAPRVTAPAAPHATATDPATTESAGTPSKTTNDRPAPVASGVRLVALAEALQLFRTPEYEQELVIFVDARSVTAFEAGHIPGAYHFDRYHAEEHLATVLPAGLNARQVVVYCTGGQCEDSHFAARQLEEAGIPADRLAVFSGGIAAWTSARLPVETGARRSGVLQPATP